MATWGQPARLRYRAWDVATNQPVDGDASNHSLELYRDGSVSTFVGPKSGVGYGGWYVATISGPLMEAYDVGMTGSSSTADVHLFFDPAIRTVKASPTVDDIATRVTDDHGPGRYDEVEVELGAQSFTEIYKALTQMTQIQGDQYSRAMTKLDEIRALVLGDAPGSVQDPGSEPKPPTLGPPETPVYGPDSLVSGYGSVYVNHDYGGQSALLLPPLSFVRVFSGTGVDPGTWTRSQMLASTHTDVSGKLVTGFWLNPGSYSLAIYPNSGAAIVSPTTVQELTVSV